MKRRVAASWVAVFPSFQGSTLGTHCPEAPASLFSAAKRHWNAAWRLATRSRITQTKLFSPQAAQRRPTKTVDDSLQTSWRKTISPRTMLPQLICDFQKVSSIGIHQGCVLDTIFRIGIRNTVFEQPAGHG